MKSCCCSVFVELGARIIRVQLLSDCIILQVFEERMKVLDHIGTASLSRAVDQHHIAKALMVFSPYSPHFDSQWVCQLDRDMSTWCCV
jgi:hypothetical protein